jgi:hypothetical protein
MVNIEPKQPRGLKTVAVKTAVQRQPRGVKEGGRFAPEVTCEATVDLVEGDEVESVPLSDGSKAFEERNKRSSEKAAEPVTEHVSAPPLIDESHTTNEPIKLGGAIEYEESWTYPPAPTRDVEKMAHFWSTVLIPDGGLMNLENADRDRDFFTYEDEFRKWQNAGPAWTARRRKKYPDEWAKSSAESLARKAMVDKVRFSQGLIPRSELRDVARLGAFWEQASELDDESRAEAAATEFVTSSGEVLKPLDVVQKYRLWEISGAFFNRVRYSRPD